MGRWRNRCPRAKYSKRLAPFFSSNHHNLFPSNFEFSFKQFPLKYPLSAAGLTDGQHDRQHRSKAFPKHADSTLLARDCTGLRARRASSQAPRTPPNAALKLSLLSNGRQLLKSSYWLYKMDFTNEVDHVDGLLVRGAQPFNAEPPTSTLVDFGGVTPEELIYCRNHSTSSYFCPN